MNSINYDLYKAVEGEYAKLLQADKENTSAGIGFKNEMDYWWKTLTPDEKKELLTSAKKELMEAFNQKFEKLFPNP